MNNCDITLLVKILATLTSDQRLDEKKSLVQRKDLPGYV